MTANDKIRHLVAKGYSVKQLSARCKVSYPVLYALLKGKSIGSKSAIRIEYTFNAKVPRAQIIGYEINDEMLALRCRIDELREELEKPFTRRVEVNNGKAS